MEIPLGNDHHPRQLQLDQVPGILKEGNRLFERSASNTGSVHFNELVSQLDCLGSLSQPTLGHAGEEEMRFNTELISLNSTK